MDNNVQASVNVDPAKLQALQEKMLQEQNLPLAVAGGFITAVIGAIIWAVVTVATGYQIGWMAVGVGFLVGLVVRYLGKGVTKPFAITGAVMALLGCGLGNLLSGCGFLANANDASVVDTVLGVLINPSVAIEILKLTASPMDLLFYGIAVYEGYNFSLRRLSEQEVSQLATAPAAPGTTL